MDPTQINTSSYDDDDTTTVITSNCASTKPVQTNSASSLITATVRALCGNLMPQFLNAAVSPFTIYLPDGKQVQSTHVCDINIPGLLTILTGHIVPSLKIASLIGIWLLCKAGCKVIFDNKKCDVIFNGKVILTGFKDPLTDLWTLPIPHETVGTTSGKCLLPQPGPCEECAPHHPAVTPNNHPGINLTPSCTQCKRKPMLSNSHISLCVIPRYPHC